MGEVNDGGAAFPVKLRNLSQQFDNYHPGMSLRDWFAGQALIAHRSSSDPQTANAPSEKIAEWAYEDADAMLKEGKK